jgi:hypothetical protein
MATVPERLAALEERVRNLSEDVRQLSERTTETYNFLQASKGAKWVVLLLATIVSASLGLGFHKFLPLIR